MSVFFLSNAQCPRINAKIGFGKCLRHLPKVFVFFGFIAFSSSCMHAVPMPDAALSDVRSDIAGNARSMPETMRMIARVDYVDEKNNKRAIGQELILSADAESHMRMTVSAFDKAVAVLVTDGTEFGLFDVGQNAFVMGLATPESISRILPVRLSARDLHRVIFGGFPLDDVPENAAESARFSWDERLGGYCYELPLKNGATQKVYYSWPEKDIFRIEVSDAGGKPIYAYEAKSFSEREADGAAYRFPDVIRFNLASEKTDVQIRVRTRDINVEFSPQVFRMIPPQGAKIYMTEAPAEIRDKIAPNVQNMGEAETKNNPAEDDRDASAAGESPATPR